MNIRLAFCTTAALVALGSVGTAFAQPVVTAIEPAPYPGERIYVPAVRAGSAIHGGFVNVGDERLLNDTVAAINSDRQVAQSIVTIVANNGVLTMSGKVKDPQTGARIERIARRVSGGPVYSFFDSQVG
jgi:BON domain-containing protein